MSPLRNPVTQKTESQWQCWCNVRFTINGAYKSCYDVDQSPLSPNYGVRSVQTRQRTHCNLSFELKAGTNLRLSASYCESHRVLTLCAASFTFWVSRETPNPTVTPGRSFTLYARAAIPRSLTFACSGLCQYRCTRGFMRRERTLAKDVGSMRYLLASSSPTLLPAFESQVAFAPAST